MSGGRRPVPKLGTLIAPLAAVVVAIVLTATVSLFHLPDSAVATHTGDLDFFLVDMDTTGNTATSIGPVEPCARINENDTLDADEALVDTIQIDVVTGPLGIPASRPMAAFAMKLEYPAGAVEVSSHDAGLLLTSLPGSAIFDLSEPVPDGDGQFSISAFDFFVTGPTGPGILSRVSLSTVTGAAEQVAELRLMSAAYVELENVNVVPHNQETVFDFGFPITNLILPSANLAIDSPFHDCLPA